MNFIVGGGNMGKLIRSTNWSETSIKEPEYWPESLLSALSICLNSGFPIAIYWGEDLTLLYNDAWSTIPGDKHPWALGKPARVVWPEIWDLIEDQFKSVLYKNTSVRSPDTLLPMQRYGYTEECYFDYSLSPIIDTQGKVQGVFNAVIETTYKVINDRRNAFLQELIQEVQRLNNVKIIFERIGWLVEHAKEDIPFCLIYSRNKSQQIFLEQSTGLPPDCLQKLTWPLEDCLATGTPLIIENLSEHLSEPLYTDWPEPCKEAFLIPANLQEKDICLVIGISPGKRLDADYKLFLYTFAHHVSTAISNSVRNEQEKIAREEIEARERQFRQLADSMPQMVWVTDASGYHEYYNQRWYDFTGTSYEQAKGEGWNEIFHPDDQEMAWDKWKHSLNTGETYEIEYRLKHGHTGNYHWVLGRAVPVYNENNEIVKWFGTCTDIHEQKLIQEQKDDFVGIASHELKTPLTSIKAFNQILLRTLNEDDKAYPFALKAADQIARLQHLIGDLLDVTKINAGKIAYNFTNFNFSELVADAVETVQHTTSTHTIVIDRTEEVDFTGDRIRLEQVINNFLTNAIKYSPDAEKVIVRSEIQENNIIVSVTDFGIGIRKENLSRLFDRYYRVDNTSTLYQGLGLGLYISSEILKRHNGSFWIESELNKGSTFYFRLPLNQNKDNVIRTPSYYKDKTIEIKYNPEEHILFVDWLGFQTFESIKSGGMLMIDILKKNKVSKVLNDNRKVKGTWSEAANWVGEEWFPMMEAAGLEYFAWIYSPSKFSQLSADKSLEVKNSSVVTKLFYNFEEALSWLNQAV